MKRLFAVFALGATMLFAGCAPAKPTVSKQWYAMNTMVGVTLFSPQDEALFETAKEAVSAVEEAVSRTKSGQIAALNENGQAVLDGHAARVMRLALAAAEKSNGAFDVTLGGVTGLWNFDKDSRVPQAQAIQAALDNTGYKSVLLEEGENGRVSVRLEKSGMNLDFGAIGKGYAADTVATALIERGVKTAIVDMGGTLVFVGQKEDQALWRVGIRSPQVPGESIAAIEVEAGFAVSTSGDYQQFFELDGRRYHHILDPKTGYPTQNGIRSVTVVTTSAAMADALSTALFVMGLDEAMAFAEAEPDFEALFVDEANNLHSTSGLAFSAI